MPPAPPRRSPLPLFVGSVLIVGLGWAAYRCNRSSDPSDVAMAGAVLLSRASHGLAPSPGESQNAFELRPAEPADPAALPLLASLAAIQAEPDDARQEKAWQGLEAQMAAAGLPAGVAHCLRPGASELELELGRRLLRRWASANPRSAADWVARQPSGAARQQGIDTVATLWAGSDLPAAIDWARQLPATGERQGALMGIAYEAARTEPVSALSLALELPESRLRDDLLAHAVAQCATLAPAAAAGVAREFPDAQLRDRLLGAIATAWADRDPAAAAGLALDSIGTPRLRDDAVIGILQRWAQKDHTAATRWVDTFPAGPLRDTAVETLRQLRPGS